MRCLKCEQQIDKRLKLHYGLHPACFTAWFDMPVTAEFTGLMQRLSGSENATFTALSAPNRSFFQGKFKKYSANLNDHGYILKMRQTEAPELPEVEYLCNQVAHTLEIPVAEFYFIDFNNDKTFVTKNFIHNRHPIDLQHIYKFRPDDQHNCEEIINTIKANTQNPNDLNTIVHTILFDSLIGNHDRHGRNLGFIVTAGRKVLSPIYDNVSYLSLESGNMLNADFNPTGRISTHSTDEPSMRDYVIELKRLGQDEKVQTFFKKINIENINNLIQKSFCSKLMKKALKKLVSKRFEELKNELSI